jgi:hypothetical protein
LHKSDVLRLTGPRSNQSSPPPAHINTQGSRHR